MPFKSEAQRRYFYYKASRPGAEGKKWKKHLRKFRKETPKDVKLPERVKTAANKIYHGSPIKVEQLEPRKHFLADRPVVFGTPNRGMAIAHLAPWTDEDFDLGSINDGPLVMEEKYPGAFDKLFKGRRGYLYAMDPEGFEHRPNLMREERVTERSPSILGREDIEDLLTALEKSDVVVKRKTAAQKSFDYAFFSELEKVGKETKTDKVLMALPGIGAILGGAWGAASPAAFSPEALFPKYIKQVGLRSKQGRALSGLLGAGAMATTGWLPSTLRDTYRAAKSSKG